MKSASEILDTKPSRRTEKIIDGYEQVATRFETLVLEIRILNSWLQQMPDFISSDKAELPNGDEWERIIDRYIEAGDDLTAAMVENAKALEEFSKAVLIKRKNTSDEKTI